MEKQIKLTETIQYNNIEEFQMWLNKPINIEKIKKNPNILIKKDEVYQQLQYLTIAEIEQQLDNVFAGLWSIENLEYSVIANAITVKLDLKVFHPVAKIMITRSGVGANPIQLKKGEKVMSFESIQFDAIKKGLPAAKATALKNAAQSLGSFFGRNLNRDDSPEYESFSSEVQKRTEKQELALQLLENSTLVGTQKELAKEKIEKSFELEKIIAYLEKKQTNEI